MKEINVHVAEGVHTLEILQGDAMPQKEPASVGIKGVLNAPASYLEKRASEIDQKKCHLTVDVEEGVLSLVIDENNPYGSLIVGTLQADPNFKSFGINDGTSRDTFELADFIKMNRSFFADRDEAMKLVSELKNFKAKVNKQLEASDDDRGNTRFLRDQIVESNIPKAFDLHIPLFKGQPRVKFRVEVNINASDFSCMLISPDAKETMDEVKERLINDELGSIMDLAPDIAIIEI